MDVYTTGGDLNPFLRRDLRKIWSPCPFAQKVENSEWIIVMVFLCPEMQVISNFTIWQNLAKSV